MISMISIFSFSPAEKKPRENGRTAPQATCWTAKFSHHFRRNVCRRVEGERTTNDNELLLVPIYTRNHVQESSPGWFPTWCGQNPPTCGFRYQPATFGTMTLRTAAGLRCSVVMDVQLIFNHLSRHLWSWHGWCWYFFFPFRGDIGVRTLGRGWLGRRVKGGMRLEMTKDMSAWKGGSLSAKRMKTPED